MKNMHTKDSDKRYQCDQCGKESLDMDKIRGHHISVHLKARPYECRFGCGAASSDKGNLRKHQELKHGEEEITEESEEDEAVDSEDIYGEMEARRAKQLLNGHMNDEHAHIQVKCDKCDKTFGLSSSFIITKLTTTI